MHIEWTGELLRHANFCKLLQVLQHFILHDLCMEIQLC